MAFLSTGVPLSSWFSDFLGEDPLLSLQIAFLALMIVFVFAYFADRPVFIR
jgi:hypothetical protein